jgi:hypothetical protein
MSSAPRDRSYFELTLPVVKGAVLNGSELRFFNEYSGSSSVNASAASP